MRARVEELPHTRGRHTPSDDAQIGSNFSVAWLLSWPDKYGHALACPATQSFKSSLHLPCRLSVSSDR